MFGQRSQWQSEELAKAFLEGVRGAIPAANLQLEVIRKILDFWQPQPSKILDLGCGDGALGRVLLERYPAAHMIFVDFSEPMLEALRKQIGATQRATVIHTDFATPAWVKALHGEGPLDVIVSGFSIHHQADDRKRELYGEIYEHLSEDGVFLNLEHVSSATPSGEALFDSFFVDHLVRFHRDANPNKTGSEIEEAYYQRPDKKENILAPVETQCDWLRQIGFQDVDCFFKIFELALFGGRKALKK